MKTRMVDIKKALLYAMLSGSMVLTGCATMGSTMLGGSSGGGSGGNAADPRLTRGSDAEFFSKSGYQACAGGAAVGALAYALINRDGSRRPEHYIAAGIAGCGVAMGANYYLDHRRSQYANTSQRLDVMSRDIQEDTRRVIARTDTARQVIQEDEQRIARIQQQMANRQVDMANARQEIATIDSNIALLRRDLANMHNKVGEYRKVADQERASGSPQEMARIDQEIETMNQRVVALQQQVESLYDQRSAITLG